MSTTGRPPAGRRTAAPSAATPARSRASTRGCSGARSPCTCSPRWPALAAPRLLGDLVEAVAGRAPPSGTSTRSSWCWPASCSLQTVLTRYARYVSQALGEQVLAELREDFVANTLALPVGVVESAGSGDLLTRTGRDVDQLGWSVRWALPEWTIALVTAVVTFVAAISVGCGWRSRACSAFRRW